MPYLTAGQTKIRDLIKLARRRILHDVLPKIIRVIPRSLSLLPGEIEIEKLSVLKMNLRNWQNRRTHLLPFTAGRRTHLLLLINPNVDRRLTHFSCTDMT